jgi:Domain of unknown function (DUF6378)
MDRAEVLDTAKGYVTKDRNATHGEPEDSFGLIAELWSVTLRHKLAAPLTGWEVAALMTQLKVARLILNPTNADNWIDGAGYLACGSELAGAQ